MASKLLTPSNLRFARFELKGLEEYAERLKKAGGDVDEAVAEAVDEIKEGVKDDIQKWASKHVSTGAVLDSVDASDVIQDRNAIYAEVGINTKIKETSWHAVFVEYGTPRMAADPGVRTAFTKWKARQKSIFKRVFEKRGLPHD